MKESLIVEIGDALEELQTKGNIRFSLLLKICKSFFGNARVSGSHHIFKTPWPGDPRINIQASKGEAKTYQVKQVIRALEQLQRMEGEDNE
jgi:predicted RNA binding protein YcfA (HicA-like mRNA interferase family)